MMRHRDDGRAAWPRWVFVAAVLGSLGVQGMAADASATTPSTPSAAATAAPTGKKQDMDKDKKSTATKDGRCDLCGSCACVRTVCVPTPKDREIKKICWSHKCEDVCIPGPSEYCGRRCGKSDECGCWSYDVWKPTCAEIRTKKVPVKTEVTRKVPGVEWKPEERCKACRCRQPDDMARVELPAP